MQKIEISLDQKNDSKELYDIIKKEVNNFLENNNLELIKMSKRGKVIYVVVKNQKQDVFGIKVLAYQTNIFNRILHIKIFEDYEYSNRAFNLKELLLFTNTKKNNIEINITNAISKFKHKQIMELKGKKVNENKKVKKGDIVKFETPVTFRNGKSVDILKYNGRGTFVPVYSIDDSIVYKIYKFREKNFEIIDKNCK